MSSGDCCFGFPEVSQDHSASGERGEPARPSRVSVLHMITIEQTLMRWSSSSQAGGDIFHEVQFTPAPPSSVFSRDPDVCRIPGMLRLHLVRFLAGVFFRGPPQAPSHKCRDGILWSPQVRAGHPLCSCWPFSQEAGLSPRPLHAALTRLLAPSSGSLRSWSPALRISWLCGHLSLQGVLLSPGSLMGKWVFFYFSMRT